ncbi:hypothetical protein MAR_007712 [Mya arenaria]|uniref:SET domain-containing protein n=1 Tax=Mya arenaria TaxID=6604 RepID=A0ABY7DW76_MYAAR|nr:hypothetical protein MAR_007712 [Mya arenaria]
MYYTKHNTVLSAKLGRLQGKYPRPTTPENTPDHFKIYQAIFITPCFNQRSCFRWLSYLRVTCQLLYRYQHEYNAAELLFSSAVLDESCAALWQKAWAARIAPAPLDTHSREHTVKNEFGYKTFRYFDNDHVFLRVGTSAEKRSEHNVALGKLKGTSGMRIGSPFRCACLVRPRRHLLTSRIGHAHYHRHLTWCGNNMAACRDVFGQNQRPCRKKANQNYLQTNTAEIELNLCYMQYIDQYIVMLCFNCFNSIDASKDTCLACMVNDLDRYTKPNCKMVKVVDDRHQPRLCLYATEMISKDTELRYDYGVADVPWRKRKKNDVKPVVFEQFSNIEMFLRDNFFLS